VTPSEALTQNSSGGVQPSESSADASAVVKTSINLPSLARSSEDQGRSEAEATIELALPLLEEAAGKPVEPMIGVHEPLAAIQDALNLHGFDELIISTLPTKVSKWLKLDLPHKAAGLGLPVTTVTARSREGAGV
jgi:hypothetical protein